MISPIVKTAMLAAALIGFAGGAAAQRPNQSQIGAIRAACRGDFQNVCSGVSPTGQAALSCLREHQASLSPACGQALSGAAADAPATGAPGAALGAPLPTVQYPLANAPAGTAPAGRAGAAQRPEVAVLRQECGADYRQLCHGVQPGGGRALACLREHQDALSPQCKEGLASFRAGR